MRDYTKFFTPRDVAEMMLGIAEPIASGAQILEPHAGNGALIRPLLRSLQDQQKVCELTVCELNSEHRPNLAAIRSSPRIRTMEIVIGDFVMQGFLHRFDVILANPPFGNDVIYENHFYRMVSLLSPRGQLVTIAPLDFARYLSLHRPYASDFWPISNWAENSDGSITNIAIVKVRAVP